MANGVLKTWGLFALGIHCVTLMGCPFDGFDFSDAPTSISRQSPQSRPLRPSEDVLAIIDSNRSAETPLLRRLTHRNVRTIRELLQEQRERDPQRAIDLGLAVLDRLEAGDSYRTMAELVADVLDMVLHDAPNRSTQVMERFARLQSIMPPGEVYEAYHRFLETMNQFPPERCCPNPVDVQRVLSAMDGAVHERRLLAANFAQSPITVAEARRVLEIAMNFQQLKILYLEHLVRMSGPNTQYVAPLAAARQRRNRLLHLARFAVPEEIVAPLAPPRPSWGQWIRRAFGF